MLKFGSLLLSLVFVLGGSMRAWSYESDDTPAATSSPEDAPDAESAPADEPAPSAEAAPPDDKRQFDLRYRFSPGEVIRTEIVHRAAVQTTIDGTTQKAETQSKSIKTWRVNEVTPQAVTFMHMVESIDMWQRAQGRKEIRYNSRTDSEAPPGYEEVAKAVGVPLTLVTMDDRGKIIKRQEKRAQPTSMSTQMTMPLPEQPIGIGDTWTSPLEVEVVLKDGATKKIHTRQKFTLERVVDNVASITVDSQILTPVSDPAIEAQLIQRLSSGTVRFDIEAGRVLSQQLDLDRHVIGFSGAASSMHYVTRFTEELLPPVAETARRAAPRSAPIESAPAKAPAKAATKNTAPARKR
jgi:hypothetical protein